MPVFSQRPKTVGQSYMWQTDVDGVHVNSLNKLLQRDTVANKDEMASQYKQLHNVCPM